MSFYQTGEAWHRSHALEEKLNDNCTICGERNLKRNMYKLNVVLPGHDTPKRWCRVCTRCIADVADLLGQGIGG